MTKSESKRKATLLYKYDIDLKDWDALFIKQNGVCAICNNICKTQDRLCVDHDHETGNTRGLLCRDCNSAIGRANHDSDLLYKLAAYIKNNS